MSNALILLGATAITVGLIPLAPKLLRLRIRVLRFLRLNWFANWHQKHFDGIVLGVRVFWGAIAILLIILLIADSASWGLIDSIPN